MIFFGKVSLVFKYISRLFRLDPGYFMLSFFFADLQRGCGHADALAAEDNSR